MEIQNQTETNTKRQEVASMLALAVAKANRKRGFCEWLSCACQFLRNAEEAGTPLEAVEVSDGWQTAKKIEDGQGQFCVRFYAESQEEALRTFEALRNVANALKAKGVLEVEDAGNPNGVEPFFLLRAKHFDANTNTQNTMKRAKIPLTIALDPQTLERLEKQAEKHLRTRANFASWIISEAMAKPFERQGVKALQKEMEERANANENPANVPA